MQIRGKPKPADNAILCTIRRYCPLTAHNTTLSAGLAGGAHGVRGVCSDCDRRAKLPQTVTMSVFRRHAVGLWSCANGNRPPCDRLPCSRTRHAVGLTFAAALRTHSAFLGVSAPVGGTVSGHHGGSSGCRCSSRAGLRLQERPSLRGLRRYARVALLSKDSPGSLGGRSSQPRNAR